MVGVSLVLGNKPGAVEGPLPVRSAINVHNMMETISQLLRGLLSIKLLSVLTVLLDIAECVGPNSTTG